MWVNKISISPYLSMVRYLTKSRFKLALECPTRLYYTNKKNEYADESMDDGFLAALAEGGFQVGELAKFLLSDDPVKDGITILVPGDEAALELTREKINSRQNAVIAEAAFKYENLFIRTDLFRMKDNHIELCEVKAKSWDAASNFWKTDKAGNRSIDKNWLPYLYDVAFQKFVLQKIYPGKAVKAHLVLVDKDIPVSIEGLNQLFSIERGDGKAKITVQAGLVRSSIGTIPLKIIPVDEECDWIYQTPVPADPENETSFEEAVIFFSDAYKNDQRIWSPLGLKCKTCPFKTGNLPGELKSGFHECWKHQAHLSDEDFDQPLVLDLWSGKAGAKSLVNDAINKNKIFLADLEKEDYFPKTVSKKSTGLLPAERRELQITKVKRNDPSFYLDTKGLEKLFTDCKPPYHFIDFETSMVALPFHANRKPYEAIAFQYSHHLMDEKGTIEHKNEFIDLDPGFPNYNFVRSLRADLHGKGGTIFRYHSHENNYLRFILKQIAEEKESVVPDKKELTDFIKEITHDNSREDGWKGSRDMVDLWELVLQYYYSPAAKGSNSVKHILPAVIQDSAFIRDRYSQPVYGTAFIPSNNFENHTWITKAAGFNPYKTLSPVLNGYDNNQLDDFVLPVEEIKDGGAAMMAYAYCQFSETGKAQKEQIKKALLRYCELDTMAMVMIWQFWGNEIGKFK